MAKIREAIEETPIDPRLIDERGSTAERKRKAGVGYFRSDKGAEHMRDSPLNTALSRKQINGAQYQAGVKLYNHWFRAGLTENFGSADMNRVFGGDGGGAGMARTEAQAFHRQRYRHAVEIIGLCGHWVLERIVCRELHFADVGHEMGWKDRKQAVAAAVQSTRNALDILAADWGITQ